ncbi:peptidoglycan-binding protein, partial [Candidatus Nomurabacteria bacterium]|nr:peptidoglycan-binding protein [Candidatus Nomurabacteria bacterium]
MLKKFLIGTIAMLAVGAFLTASAADFGTTTLKVGSKGEAVKAVQTLVGAEKVDGVFGKLTAAKVMVWQAANGLKADGVFGPASKAKANAGSTVTTSAGCPAGAMFNSLTGAACTTTAPSTVAGCATGALFSATTGASCTTGATGTISTNGLEGTITTSFDGAPANGLTVNKGENKDVFAVKVKAQGSDMKVTRMWVDVTSRVWLAADTATLKDGSTVIATLPLTASTVTELTAGSAYRLEFNGLNFVVAKDATKLLTLNINRPTLTTNDTDWVISAVTLRAVDGAGITDTYTLPTISTGVTRNVDMGTTTATTGTMTVSLNSNSPLDMSVSGLSSTSGVTTNIKLMDFDLKATDGPLNVTEVKGTLTSSAATDVASLELRDGTNVLSSVTVGAGGAFDFTTLSIDIAKDTTKTLSINAVVNSITAVTGVTVGDSVKATVTNVYATSGGTYATADKTGISVAGNTMHLFKYAPTITL